MPARYELPVSQLIAIQGESTSATMLRSPKAVLV